MVRLEKRLSALFLAVVMLLALAACGGQNQGGGTSDAGGTSQPSGGAQDPVVQDGSIQGNVDSVGEIKSTGYVTDEGKTALRVGVPDILTDIYPFSASTKGRHYTINSVYQLLFERNKYTGELVMVLAKEVETVDDVTFNITIHDNIYDSAGNHFTASDAVFSINKCKEDNNIVASRLIIDAKIIDDYTLQVTMNNNAFYQLGSAVGQVYMITEAAYNSGVELGTVPVGTGPYDFKEFIPGASLVMEKRDDYWGADLADESTNTGWYWHAQNVDEIHFQLIKESSQMVVALETGTVDVIQNPSAEDGASFLDKEGFNVWKASNWHLYFVQFNCSELSPCQDLLLRQAICYAIERQGCIDAVGGLDRIATTYGSQSYADVLPEWADQDYYNYDVEKAAQLVKESGFDTSQTLRIMCMNPSKDVAVAQVIQGYLLAAGIQSEILQYDSATYNTYRFDPTAYDIRLDKSADEGFASFVVESFSTETRDDGMSNGFFVDPEMQKRIEACRTVEGHTDENLTALHEHIRDNAYGYGLFSNEDYNASVDGVIGYTANCKLYLLPGACTYADGFFG